MRVLLAAAPHADTFGYSMPPPGLLRLGGWLERAGQHVELVDLPLCVSQGELPLDERFAEHAAELLLARGEFDCFGLSVMGATLPAALCIAAALRARRPRARIALGGPGAGGIDVELLRRFAALDVIVRGEGEATLLDWLGRVERGADLTGCAGLTWRDARGAVVRERDRAPLRADEWAPHAWHLVPAIDAYKRAIGARDGLVALDSGRGCAWDCSFCSIGRYWNRRTRALPAPRLAAEIEHAFTLHGVQAAYLAHDVFGTDRAHALELCAELERRGARHPFEIRARADALDDVLVEALGRAGCYRVLIGVESGDPALRDAHGKQLARDCDVLALVDRLDAAGVTPILSLLLGLPGEDDAALESTLELALACALRAGVNLSLHLPNPQPGCRLGDELGASARAVDGIAPDMALGAGTTRLERELIAAHPDLFGTFALLARDDADERALRRLAALRDELAPLLQRLPRTFALVAQRGGRGVAQQFDAWRASGRGFESAARALRDPLVDDVLAWEQALLRGSARGELLVLRHDLARVRRALVCASAARVAAVRDAAVRAPAVRDDERAPCRDDASLAELAARVAAELDAGLARARSSEPLYYAVSRGPRGPRTVRISADLARAHRARSDGASIPDAARDVLARAGLREPPLARCNES